MNPERWGQIKQIHHAALELEPSRREAFVKEACAGDESLLKEVASLLAQEGRSEGLFESPALDAVARALAEGEAHMPQQNLTGHTLLHYRIEEKIGEGGMGVVYRAQDTSLERTVALKILPPAFASDESRMRRFIREAKAASALSHPNVATIYEVGEAEGVHFIVMEFISGQTLSEWAGKHAPEPDQVIDIGIQMADALDEAHEKGIIHRDLKPANVMITARGQAKVLDFGLAKMARPASQVADSSAVSSTESGLVLGTVAYMSPEQVLGHEVDNRTDIFSLGTVLYELTTGHQPFSGATTTEIMDRILHARPEAIARFNDRVSADLERIIRKCLEKDQSLRYQHASDLGADLKRLKRDTDADKLAAEVSKPKPRRYLLWGTALLLISIIAATGIWFFWLGIENSEAPMVPVPFTSYPGREGDASFSPDGNQVVFAWNGEQEENRDIYVKQVGGETPRRLTTDPRNDLRPVWSPDGQSIAFLRSLDDARTAVILISPNGGRERQVAELPTLKTAGRVRLCWHPSGRNLAVACDQAPVEASFGIFLLSPETGEKRLLCSPPKPAPGDCGPAFSPDGRSLAFSRYLTGAISQLYLLQVSQGILPEGQPRQLTFMDRSASEPAWTSDGREIIYVYGRRHRSSLWRIPASGRGTPKPLPFSGSDAFSPAISPQNRRLIYTLEADDIDIWRCEIPRAGVPPGPPSKHIATTQTDHLARYSPDGKEIAYVSYSSGTPEIWICDSNGSNPSQLTRLGGHEPEAPTWSPDGRRIIFEMKSGISKDLFLIPAQGGREKQLTQTPDNESRPCFSNDGRWIYYASDRSGENQIWRMAENGGKATQITRKGGFCPAIAKDGKTLYYLKGEIIGLATHDLWKVPEEGGEESRVLGGVSSLNFDVRENGIFYATQSVPGVTELLLHGFADAKTKHIATTRLIVGYGFTVSPDEHWLLFTGGTNYRSDLMLVENFR